ncbi:MAG: amidase [Burkholderiaceae bacterium]|nr:amidase [Burkholderiaceae bacterium]
MGRERIRATARRIAAGNESASKLLEQARAAAERAKALNPIAFVDWEAAAERARALDAELAAGTPRGALHGIPISIKDLFNVRGMPTRGGTRAALPDLGRDEAELVTRLRAAGALIFAKTNMHEIALGATGENAWTGDVCNPFDPARQAGGSSSGAAVSVASGIGLGAVGSDTGGSVRVPAAFCGVSGFKPSYGAIPLAGSLYLSWTCDHAGPIAESVDDCALLFEAMALRSSAHGRVPRAPRLAVPRPWLAGRMSAAVASRFERVLLRLAASGAVIESHEMPALSLAWAHYTPIVRAEAAFVHRAALAAGGEGFSESVRAPMIDGGGLPAIRYLEAMNARERVRASLAAVLRDFDAIVLPTSPVLPPLRGQLEVEVAGGRTLSTREAVLGQTLPFSMAGLPALSIPCGFEQGLPVGLQVVGAFDADARLLALGRWIEETLEAEITSAPS